MAEMLLTSSRCYHAIFLYLFSMVLLLMNLYQLMYMSSIAESASENLPDSAQVLDSEDKSLDLDKGHLQTARHATLEAAGTSDSLIFQLKLQPVTGSKDRNLKEYKTILLPSGYPRHVYPEDLTFQQDQCPFANCLLTDNSKNFDRADAVLFQSGFPPAFVHHSSRNPAQLWIYFELEPPTHTLPLNNFSHLFNWTATYRLDSTLVTPYAKFVPYQSSTNGRDISQAELGFLHNRLRKVAWMVSNCDTTNNRWDYVRKLQQHIEVDIYGNCGPLKCPRSQENECLKMLQRTYKFYLAFENSNCIDYITEKFYQNALRQACNVL